ncbi:MAG: hypothetical protein ACLFV7_12930 [Phycisphaerae bacterium]
MRHLWIVLTVLAILAGPAGLGTAPAPAQNGDVPSVKDVVTVVVTGAGTTEEEAIRDAKRKACEKGGGTFIYSQSKAKDFVLIKDTILTRSNGFVQKFEVLKKGEEDGIHRIEAKVVVSVKGIADAWAWSRTCCRRWGARR